MTSLLLAVVAVALQSPVDDRIQAFLKGDPAARKDLLTLGAPAILPLQKVREKKPEAVDALVLELKKSAAYPRGSGAASHLQAGVDISLAAAEYGPAVFDDLRKAGIPVFVDPFDLETLKTRRVSVTVKGPAREFLDQACRQAGVDYGFFHNHIVIGRPERLWPSAAKKTIVELKGDALLKVKDLIDKLGDPSRDERLSAMDDLAGMGPEILPQLESGLKRKDVNISSRCSALYERLRPWGDFGAPGAAKQLRTGLQDDHWKKLRTSKLDAGLAGAPLSELLTMIKAGTGIPFEIETDDGKQPVTLQAKGQAVADLLALATQGQRLDYLFTDTGIAVGVREEIEVRVLDGKK